MFRKTINASHAALINFPLTFENFFSLWLRPSSFFFSRNCFLIILVFLSSFAFEQNSIPLGSRTTKNPDVSTISRSIAPLTHLLASHCLLCLRAPLRSFVRLFAHSRARGNVYDSMSQNDLVLPHSKLLSISRCCRDRCVTNLVN